MTGRGTGFYHFSQSSQLSRPRRPAGIAGPIERWNLYSLVLLAAMAGGGEAAAQGYFHADPCCWCVWPVFPMGGRVIFFWAGPAGMSEQEEKEWQDYIDALDEADKADAVYFWTRADKKGKLMLLTQVRTMRAAKDAYDKKKAEEEAKAKEADPPKKNEKDKKVEKKEKNKKDDDKDM